MKTIEKQDSHHMRPGRENAVTAVTGVERGLGGARPRRGAEDALLAPNCVAQRQADRQEVDRR